MDLKATITLESGQFVASARDARAAQEGVRQGASAADQALKAFGKTQAEVAQSTASASAAISRQAETIAAATAAANAKAYTAYQERQYLGGIGGHSDAGLERRRAELAAFVGTPEGRAQEIAAYRADIRELEAIQSEQMRRMQARERGGMSRTHSRMLFRAGIGMAIYGGAEMLEESGHAKAASAVRDIGGAAATGALVGSIGGVGGSILLGLGGAGVGSIKFVNRLVKEGEEEAKRWARSFRELQAAYENFDAALAKTVGVKAYDEQLKQVDEQIRALRQKLEVEGPDMGVDDRARAEQRIQRLEMWRKDAGGDINAREAAAARERAQNALANVAAARQDADERRIAAMMRGGGDDLAARRKEIEGWLVSAAGKEAAPEDYSARLSELRGIEDEQRSRAEQDARESERRARAAEREQARVDNWFAQVSQASIMPADSFAQMGHFIGGGGDGGAMATVADHTAEMVGLIRRTNTLIERSEGGAVWAQ